MTDLIQRIEAAKEPRRELFEEAFALLHPCPGQETIPLHKLSRNPTAKFDPHTPYAVWMGKVNSFQQMLDAQAWTSAAEMLVPEGCLHVARAVWDNADAPLERAVGYASIDRYFRDEQGLMWKENFLALAAHPSLALLAAILRAERKDDE